MCTSVQPWLDRPDAAKACTSCLEESRTRELAGKLTMSEDGKIQPTFMGIIYYIYIYRAKLHGKRRIERRLFFQPLQVHFPCVFSGFSAFVHFLDPLKSYDKLLGFINVVSVSVYFFLSQALQDVS